MSNSSFLIPMIADRSPTLVAALGEHRNPNTRCAYARAAVEFPAFPHAKNRSVHSIIFFTRAV